MNDSVVDVILLDVPVPLWVKSREHLDTVLKELSGVEGTPTRIAELRCRLRDDYSVVAETSDSELRSAAVRRAKTVDVAYPVPRRGRDDIQELMKAFDSLDRYVKKADRKDLATPADVRSFRKWYFGEIVKQLDGGFPSPWPGD